jgi:hypothetical protein
MAPDVRACAPFASLATSVNIIAVALLTAGICTDSTMEPESDFLDLIVSALV